MPTPVPPSSPPSQTGASAPAAPRPPRRWLGSAIAVVALAALGALAWYLTHPAAGGGAMGAGAASGARPGGAAGGPGGRRAPATTVGVAVAERMDVPVLIDALGTVTPSATVTVRPQVSGTMKSVRFEEGQLVKAGQLLAEIDARPFEMSLMQAQGARLRDQAQLDNARLTLKRYETLWKQDSIARQDVDTQAALVKQLEGSVISGQGSEGTARLNLGYTRVVAPIAGRVGLRTVDVGNVVSAGDANGIAVITRLAPIDVEFALPQDRVPEVQRRVAAGAALPVTVLDRNRTSELDRGSFSTLNNQADTQTGTVRAKARFPNAQGALFPSQFVNVRLLLDTLAGAVVVPTSALRHGAESDFVFVLQDDQTVLQRKVVAGQAVGDKVVIASGVAAGERVITEGADRLKDGARVVLPGERAASGAAGMPGRGASGGRRGDGASGARRATEGSADGASRPRGPSDGASRPYGRRASEVPAP
ncbi:MAG: efflux RND transporter periplasmic adaptor subunit [Burkholderiaceae bacterium]